jgi:hypothetical protein
MLSDENKANRFFSYKNFDPLENKKQKKLRIICLGIFSIKWAKMVLFF